MNAQRRESRMDSDLHGLIQVSRLHMTGYVSDPEPHMTLLDLEIQ